MLNIWTHFTKHPRFRQLALVSGMLMTTVCYGQSASNVALISRMPASYVPDDDVIVKPVENELSFYQQYVASDKSETVVESRNQLKIWLQNQTFAEQYGMDTSLTGSPFYVPTAEEKWDYFQDKYLRYLKRKGEQPLKNMPKEWYQDYRASNQIDTIDEMEARFKEQNGKKSKSVMPKAFQEKEVSLWSDNRLIFQPRLDQGLVIVGIKGPLLYARAWVGINGQTDLNIQKSFDSIGLRAMYNFDAKKKVSIASVDQRLADHLYARVTSNKDPETEVQDNTVMLLYAKQF